MRRVVQKLGVEPRVLPPVPLPPLLPQLPAPVLTREALSREACVKASQVKSSTLKKSRLCCKRVFNPAGWRAKHAAVAGREQQILRGSLVNSSVWLDHGK